MIYLLITLLLIFCVIDIIKNKKILSPSFVFNFIWFITLSLYEFKLSYIQQDLSNMTVLVLFICVLTYNVTLLLLKVLKLKEIKFNFNFGKTETKLKIAKFAVLIILLVEIVYSKGFPLLWKLLGTGKTYVDYGISSLHGAFCGLVICLGAYSIYKNKKDKYFYFLIGILLISRQILMSMILEWLVLILFDKSIKDIIKKLIFVGIACILGFTIIGNVRSGNAVMNDVFQAKNEYKLMPSSVKWVYSYMTFSLSNFNNLVSMTEGGINNGASMLNEFLPTVILNKLNIKQKFSQNFLVSPNYNTSTYLPSIYLDFEIFGIVIFNVLMAILGHVLYNNLKNNRCIKNLMLYSIFIHNIVLLFFINMFLYLPVTVQFLYVLLLFNDEKIKYERKQIKKENDLVSIIVPVYNVEKYLNKCIDSILNQTYDNFELLLIDDGSTDNSGFICDEYSKEDNRIVVIHKKNSGVSSARNDGINKSKGKYLVFVDSDDWIESNYLERCISIFNKYNIDYIFSNMYVDVENKSMEYISIQEDTIVDEKQLSALKSSIFSLKFAKENNLYYSRGCSGKMYKSSIIKNNKLYFSKKIYLLEDGIFNLAYINECKNAFLIRECLYHYRQISTSASHRYNKDQLKQYKRVEKELLKYINNKKQLEYYQVVRFQHLLTYVARNVRFNNKNICLKNMTKVLNNDYKDLIHNIKLKNLKLSEKIACLLFKIGNINLIYNSFKLKDSLRKT